MRDLNKNYEKLNENFKNIQVLKTQHNYGDQGASKEEAISIIEQQIESTSAFLNQLTAAEK